MNGGSVHALERLTLDELLRAAVAAHGGRPAIVGGAGELTYAELDDAVARLVGVLRASCVVEPGDRVALVLGNVVAFPVALFAALRCGAIVVPLNPQLKPAEIIYALGDAEASLVIADEHVPAARVAAEAAGVEVVELAADGLHEWLAAFEPVAEVVPRSPDDTAVIIYTSGTTGRPKGAELTHASLVRNAHAAAELLRLEREDVMFGALPLFHSFGLTVTLNATLAVGASLALLERFDPERALRLMHEHGVSVCPAVPTMHIGMLAAAAEQGAPPRLRVAVSGGARLAPNVSDELERTFGYVRLEGYGLSETSPIASWTRLDGLRKPGSIGHEIPGVEIAIVDPAGTPLPAGEIGELTIRGHNVMRGYWRRPEATREAIRDGWFRSGDLAYRDEDGELFVVGREKELVIRGGYNVYPREIEDVLQQHEAVREAAVVGVPDERLGEEVAAAVVVDPAAAVSAETLREFVRTRTAAYKYPRIVQIVDELPRGPTGKVLKHQIVFD